MAITFDPVNRRIILDTASVTAGQIWEAWTAWVILSDNLKWLPALTQVGGDDLGSGTLIPLYFFLENDWRVRPMESSHNLLITGNLFVRGGGVPVVNTIGNYNVIVNYTVPVQAQAVSTSGADPTTIANAVKAAIQTYLDKLDVNVSTRHPSGVMIPANVKQVNDANLSGNGQPGSEWGPA